MEDNSELRAYTENLMSSAQKLVVMLDGDPKGKAVLRQYMKFLFSERPRSYADLAEFLEWYGKNFLYEDIERVLQGRRYKRIMELGSGTGWLINSLSHYAEERMALDKRTALINRKEGVMFLGQDLELKPEFLKDSYLPGTALIIANQFLHCVDNRDVIVRINRADWLVIEVISIEWRKQLRLFGATPLSPAEVSDLFGHNEYKLLEHRRSGMVELTYWRPL